MTRRVCSGANWSPEEIRIEELRLQRDGALVQVTSASLQITVTIGARPVLGTLLLAVPTRLARARWWTTVLDPIVRTVLPGVRTRGSAGNGRREWYAALDLHRISAVDGVFDGSALGELAPVRPPVAFGFGSVPEQPSIVRVTTTVAG